MVYLTNTTTPQVLRIPKSESIEGDLSLVIKNTIDLDTPVDITATDTGEKDLYYTIAITLPSGCPAGEYEYTLKAGTDILSSGLLILTESEETIEYNKSIEYEQYKAD